MTAAAMTWDETSSLRFASSESKAVGGEGRFMKMLHDNAPRIVGAVKMVGDLLIGWQGLSLVMGGTAIGGFLIGYTVLALVGRTILMAYGTKEHEKKLAQEATSGNPDGEKVGALGKMSRPSHYPLESSSAISMAAETSALGFGIAQIMTGNLSGGIMNTLLEVVAIWLYGNILFGKEKKKSETPETAAGHNGQSLTFAHSESHDVGFFGHLRDKMKDNPVLVSSMVGIAISLGLLASGVIGSFGPLYFAGAAVLFVANTLQALLVQKNDYNIEGAKDAKKAAHAPTSFQERVATQRFDQPAPQLGQ